MITLIRPETAPILDGADDELRDCIVCECRPNVSYCGAYQEGPIDNSTWHDEEICPGCLQVEESSGCPGCGCHTDERCQRCDMRPWWRRWFS